MARLPTVREFANGQQEIVQKLADRSIVTIDDLWGAVGKVPESGISDVAKLTGVPAANLIEILKRAALREAESTNGNKMSSYTLPLLVSLVLPLFFLALLVIRDPLAEGAIRQGAGAAVVVSGSDGIPAFHLLSDRDIAEKKVLVGHTWRQAGTLERPQQLTGRYTLVPIAAGAPVLDKQLSLACETAGTAVLSMLVKTSNLGDSKPGDCVALLLSPRDRSGTPVDVSVLYSMPLLAVSRSGDQASVAVAVPSAQLQLLSRALASSDAFVVRQAP